MLFNSIFTSDNTLFVLRAIRRLAFGNPLCEFANPQNVRRNWNEDSSESRAKIPRQIWLLQVHSV